MFLQWLKQEPNLCPANPIIKGTPVFATVSKDLEDQAENDLISKTICRPNSFVYFQLQKHIWGLKFDVKSPS